MRFKSRTARLHSRAMGVLYRFLFFLHAVGSRRAKKTSVTCRFDSDPSSLLPFLRKRSPESRSEEADRK